MKFELSDSFSINSEDYSKEGLRIAILGMSGSGKSNTAALIAEQILDGGGQIMVVEPVAEWHTLKAKYGNVVVIGGPFQDLPLEPDFVGEYVETALSKGINLVVSLGEMESEEEMRGFVSSLLWSLYRRQQRFRRPIFLFLEEADIWAPQEYDKFSKRCRDRVRTIAQRGRKVGIFTVFITQRPAVIDKTPLTQCPVQIFGKFEAAQDLSRSNGVMFLVEKLGVKVTERDFMSLQPGEFYVHDVKGFSRVRVTRARETPHGADTPDIEFTQMEVELAPALDDLKRSILEAVARRREEKSDVERLQGLVEKQAREIAGLEEKLKIKATVEEILTGQTGPQGSKQTNLQGMPEDVHRREVEELKGTVLLLQSQLGEFEALKAEHQKLLDRTRKFSAFEELLRGIMEPLIPQPQAISANESVIEAVVDRKLQRISIGRKRKMASDGETGIPWVDLWLPKLGTAERKIITFMAGKFPLKMTRSQIAIGTGLTAKGGYFNNAFTNLVRNRLLVEEGDLYKLAETPA